MKVFTLYGLVFCLVIFNQVHSGYANGAASLGCCMVDNGVLKNCQQCPNDVDIAFSTETGTPLVTDIDDGAFDHPSNDNVESLILNSHQILAIRKEMFRGLGNLRELQVNRNGLTSVDEDAFEHVPLLNHFEFIDNDLTSLPAKLLFSTPLINEIDIQNNEIDWLDPFWLSKVDHNEGLALDAEENDIPFLWSGFFEEASVGSIGFFISLSGNGGHNRADCGPDPPGFQDIRPSPPPNGFQNFCFADFRAPSATSSVVPTQTPSRTSTRTPTASNSRTATPSASNTRTPTSSRTPSPSATRTATVSPSATPAAIIKCCRALDHILFECICPDITVLDLSCNGIQGIASGTFDFSENEDMDTLILNDNSLSSLANGAFRGLSSLRTLSLVKNQFESLTETPFEGLKSLTNLYLSQNKLSWIHPGVLSNTTRLEVLLLDDNEFTSFHEDVFSNLEDLHLIELERNRLEVLPEDLFLWNTNLTYIHFGEEGCPEKHNPGQTSCPCRGVTPETVTSDALMRTMNAGYVQNLHFCIAPSMCCTLEEGVLSNCNCNRERLNLAHKEIVSVEDYAFYGSSELEYLYLHNNNIEFLERAWFEHLDNLITLSLSNNKLTVLPERVFCALSNLRNLYLASNEFADFNSCSLKGMPNLEKLVLKDNQLRSVDARTFYPGNKHISALYLQRNEIESFEANVFESFSDNLGFTLLEGNPGASQCTSGGNFESQEVCSGNPTFCYTEPVGPLPTCIPCAPQV